jgi:UPF0755 protein
VAGRTVKTIGAGIALATLIAVAAGLALWRQYESFIDTPLAVPPAGYVYTVRSGASGRDLVADLARLGLTRDGWQWQLLMRLEPAVYRTGEYRLEAGMRPRDVLRRLSEGPLVQYRFTLVEGWTFRQLWDALASDPVLVRELERDTDPLDTVRALLPDVDHPEGWFLPETYLFTRGDSDRDILERAHAAMKNALQDAWSSRDLGLPLETPHELLVLASIIEKETARDDERERIAGVFVRRLQKGMRLQTDPTVIYGMGEAFDGDIRKRDLTTDTPYNTYTRHGLPPTPIAMPGRASLEAAAHPAPGEELYFVTDGSGGHTFSKTLAEHQAAVRKLVGKP